MYSFYQGRLNKFKQSGLKKKTFNHIGHRSIINNFLCKKIENHFLADYLLSFTLIR